MLRRHGHASTERASAATGHVGGRRCAFQGRWPFVAVAVVAVTSGGAGLGCGNGLPTEDVLTVQGVVDGVDIDFEDGTSRGEWLPCDLRLTSTTCVDDRFHVSVFVGLPGHQGFEDIGGASCVEDGVAQGAFEIMKAAEAGNDNPVIGVDVSAFILVGSDVDGDGSADFNNPDETLAAVQLTEGTIDIASLQGFDDPLLITIAGSASGEDIEVTFLGEMSVPRVVSGIESANTCVRAR